MQKTFMTILTILLFSCSSADANENNNTVLRKVSVNDQTSEKFNRLLQPEAPGFQYIIVNKETTVFQESGGLANIKNRNELTQHHTMAAFSMTKTLTAIAILQLTQQMKIDLDAEVSTYIEHPYDQHISIRQLLNHTSGIPDPIPLKWVHLEKDHPHFNEELALTKVLTDNPDADSKPGEKYSYSNIGYWLLGKVIEKASGDKYADYIQNNIFEVIELQPKDISFTITNKNIHAKGYLKKWSFMNIFGRLFIDSNLLGEYENNWLRIHDVYVNGPSFGGVIATASAFIRILQDLLSEESKLLNKQSKRLLYSQQTINSGEYIDMTLGWQLNKLSGVTYYYKEGGGAGFHSEMRIYPDEGLASVIMTNKTSFNSRKVLNELDNNFIKAVIQ